MDFELKNFEDKINDITNQFMSLLDSKDIIGDSVGEKFDNTSKAFAYSFDSITAGGETSQQDTHANATGDETHDLNKRLEDLYQARKFESAIPNDAETSKYIGTNVGVFNSIADKNRVSYTNDKTSSLENKEGYTMANYGFNAEDGNSLFSFATIPEEKALVAKKSFSDVLFMDIPWDTKIDIMGGFKSFLNTDVKFTF